MRLGKLRPTVVAMSTNHLLRIGAVAAVAGAGAQLVATVLEPDWGGDPGKSVRIVADSGLWTADRLLDLIGVLLAVGALTVAGRTFTEGAGRDWARAGQPFLLLMGALGAGAVVAGANMKELADTWAGSASEAKGSYLAAFDATSNATEDLFFAAFLALGIYLAALAAAILMAGVHARWIGWASAVSAALVLCGDLMVLVSDAAFVAVLAGFALFMAVLIALGVSMWRQAAAPQPCVVENEPLRVGAP